MSCSRDCGVLYLWELSDCIHPSYDGADIVRVLNGARDIETLFKDDEL